MVTCAGATTQQIWFCLSCQFGSTVSGESLLLENEIPSYCCRPLFQKGTGKRKGGHKCYLLFWSLQRVSISLNIYSLYSLTHVLHDIFQIYTIKLGFTWNIHFYGMFDDFEPILNEGVILLFFSFTWIFINSLKVITDQTLLHTRVLVNVSTIFVDRVNNWCCFTISFNSYPRCMFLIQKLGEIK